MTPLTLDPNLIAPIIATTIAELATLPICTLKTNYQNSGSKSIISTLKSVYASGGISAFYRASAPAITAQIFTTTSKYYLYNKLNELNEIHSYGSNRVIHGILAGILTSLITHPIDMFKIHSQMNLSMLSEVKTHGLKTFYRGYSKTFSKTILSGSMFFPLYDYSKAYLNNPLLASAFSGFVSATLMHPIDYLKTRHIAGLKLYDGLNPRTYYKGYSINLLRIVPHFVITMGVIEWVKEKM